MSFPSYIRNGRFMFNLRISALEMLDEVEELNLVLEHYAITWAVKLDGSPELSNSSWAKWGMKSIVNVLNESE